MPGRRLEILHVGSASRDIAPDDPRGWRLGGGVTYAALTTARLGLRTAALVGADAVAAHARELDELRDAGVLVAILDVATSPVFHNLETPEGRRQTCLEPGTPLGIVDLPQSWHDARAWSFAPVAGEVRDDWVAVIPDGAYVVVGWQGFLRELTPGEPVRRAEPGPSALLARADLVGVSHTDVDPATSLADLTRWLKPGADLLVTRGNAGGLLVRVGDGRTCADRPLPAHGRRRGGPDRCRGYVPRGARGECPPSGHRRAASLPAAARPAVRRGGRIARGRGGRTGRRSGPGCGQRPSRSRADPTGGAPDPGAPGRRLPRGRTDGLTDVRCPGWVCSRTLRGSEGKPPPDAFEPAAQVAFQGRFGVADPTATIGLRESARHELQGPWQVAQVVLVKLGRLDRGDDAGAVPAGEEGVPGLHGCGEVPGAPLQTRPLDDDPVRGPRSGRIGARGPLEVREAGPEVRSRLRRPPG